MTIQVKTHDRYGSHSESATDTFDTLGVLFYRLVLSILSYVLSSATSVDRY